VPEVVFDASVILALARREPGADRVLPLRDHALASAVNVTEVYSKLLTEGFTRTQIADGLRAIVRRVVPFDGEQAVVAAELHVRTRPHGFSLADCACLALGQVRGVTVFTADRAWAEFDLGVAVEKIR
jgi:PIN domain nuclease of toxin-antitoxin system